MTRTSARVDLTQSPFDHVAIDASDDDVCLFLVDADGTTHEGFCLHPDDLGPLIDRLGTIRADDARPETIRLHAEIAGELRAVIAGFRDWVGGPIAEALLARLDATAAKLAPADGSAPGGSDG